MGVDPILVGDLIDLVRLAPTISVQEFVRRLFDIAARTGIAPALLAEYLTEAGIRFAENAADIAQEAKLKIRAMKGEPT